MTKPTQPAGTLQAPRRSEPVRATADWELLAGLLVLLLVAGAAALIILVGTVWQDESAAIRVGVPVLVIVLTLTAASTQWTRHVLRTVVVLLLFGLALVTLDVGRDALDGAAEDVAEAEPTGFWSTFVAMINEAIDALEAEPVGFIDVLRAGVEDAINDLPGQEVSLPVALDAVLGILLAVLALAWWRLVEQRSGQQVPGPVTITFTPLTPPTAATSGTPAPSAPADDPGVATQTTPASGEAQKAEFRLAVLRNLTEPGAAPGAATTVPVTDLFELATLGPTWLKPVVSAVRAALSPPTGYDISADLLAPGPSRKTWQVLVRVSARSTGRQVGVQTLAGGDPTTACRAGGYWAAAAVLSRSTRVAGWARWDRHTAQAWAAYDEVDEVPTPALEDAVRRAPDSGLLLHRLADRYDLKGRYREALALYCRAVAAHPRYPAARYRMAVSTRLVADALPEQWFKAAPSERLRVARQLQRACASVGVRTAETGLDGLDMATAAAAGKTLSNVHAKLMDLLVRSTRRQNVLIRFLRRSERQVFWPSVRDLWRPWGEQARRHWLVRSARPNPRQGNGKSKEMRCIEDRAGDRRSWWQLSYNLACYYAHSGPDQAVTWLERALERPGCHLMGVEWVATDPDLEPLRTHPRFQWVLAAITPLTPTPDDSPGGTHDD